MTREEKNQVIDTLAEKLEKSTNLYLTDVSELSVKSSNDLRRAFFNKDVEMQVVKNSLLKKAMEKVGNKYEGAYDVLKGNTALVFSDTANVPAKIIKEFRKKNDKPILKAAFLDSELFIGDDQIKILATLKSKNELIGEIIGLLQSPAKNVISALMSGSANISGILKTLSDRPENANSSKVENMKVESAETKNEAEAPDSGKPSDEEKKNSDAEGDKDETGKS